MQNIAVKLVIAATFTTIGIYGADTTVGTWKFNAAKSKTTDINPVKSRTDTREETPDGGTKLTRAEELKDGTSRNYTYTCKYDGKECPVTGAPFDSVSIKRVDAHTTSFESKHSATKFHVTGRVVVSKDGKTLTQTYKGTDAAGKRLNTKYVFDKQ